MARMRTHSGSWWLDLLNRFGLLFDAWATLGALAGAWYCAHEGDLSSFLFCGGFAVLMGVAFSSAAESELSHAERMAMGNQRIEQLRAEIKKTEADTAAIRAATERMKQRAQERAG